MLVDKQYDAIDVAELHFDPGNPRLPAHVDPSDESSVLDWMLEDAGLVELMGSIATKGYFPAEPLLITDAEDADGYWVLEGNRRLAAIKLLLNPQAAPRRKAAVLEMATAVEDLGSLRTLPCAFFESRAEVQDYLGYRHITGIKQWEPAAKARYLQTLFDAHSAGHGAGVYRHIARLIGSKQDYVKRLLGALRLHERIESLDVLGRDDDVSFSLLTLALNYSSIVDFLRLDSLDQPSFDRLDEDNLAHLARWLYAEDPASGRTTLGDSRNMRLLAAAVSKEEGIEALVRGEPVEEAAQATLDPTDMFLRAVRTARSRLLAAQAVLHRADVTEATLSTIEEIAELVSQLEALARRKQRADRAAGV